MFTFDWYAVQTRSNFEKRVSAELTAKGIEAFLPVYPEIHRWKDRKKLIEIPFFPGYLFVRMAATDACRLQVLQTTGAVRILGTYGTMEPIPETEIQSLQRVISVNVRVAPHPFLREGAHVRVKRGPLQGLEGQLIRWKSEVRLVLSVQLLCQAVAVEVDSGDVEVLRAPQEQFQNGVPLTRWPSGFASRSLDVSQP
jgi:transcription antitermination factor NusG